MAPPRRMRSAWPVVAPAAALGAAAALLLFAPAQWLRVPLAQLTGERLLIEQAQGSIWRGQARLILSAGPGSSERQRLPGTLQWQWGPALEGVWPVLRLQLRQSCCMTQAARWRLGVAGKELSLRLEDAAAPPLLVWPAAWLGALGTPWNTLQPGGRLSLSTAGLELGLGRAGPERFSGMVALQIEGASSRLSTLPTLGSYLITLQGTLPATTPTGRPDSGSDAGALARVQLQTLEGPLRLQAEGSVGRRGLRLDGEARAEAGREAALDNLLNLLGRRDGARSILSIGRK